jgi:hypothetical protein
MAVPTQRTHAPIPPSQSKAVYEILVEELNMQPRQRQTKLSVNTRILAALRFFATGMY